MKSLVTPTTPPTFMDLYISIRDSKRNPTKTTLNGAHALILTQYGSFENFAQAKTLERFTHDNNLRPIKDALRSCYGGKTKALQNLKDLIESVQPARRLIKCPMCNITLPRTFDHYLAAEKFPELSVHGLNLIPCCSTCNSIKDDDWLDGNGERQYIHYFSDNLTSLNYLECSITVRPGFNFPGANFSISKPTQMPNIDWGLLVRHFNRLHLIERYNELGNDTISYLLRTCKAHIDAGGTQPGVFLSNYATNDEEDYGVNYWVAVLTRKLVAHPNFLQWI